MQHSTISRRMHEHSIKLLKLHAILSNNLLPATLFFCIKQSIIQSITVINST